MKSMVQPSPRAGEVAIAPELQADALPSEPSGKPIALSSTHQLFLSASSCFQVIYSIVLFVFFVNVFIWIF